MSLANIVNVIQERGPAPESGLPDGRAHSVSPRVEEILTQLERLQRVRLGQPVPPPVKVEVST